MSITRFLVSHSSYRAGMIFTAGRGGRIFLGELEASSLPVVVVAAAVAVVAFVNVVVNVVGDEAFSPLVGGATRFSGVCEPSSEPLRGICGPSAGARGSPPDDRCDELEPALRFSISLPTSTRVRSVAAVTAVDMVFSIRRSGGEYCVPASTVR